MQCLERTSPASRRRSAGDRRHAVVRDRPRPDEGRRDLRIDDRRALHRDRGRRHLHRPDRARRCTRSRSTARAVPCRRVRRLAHPARRPRRAQRARSSSPTARTRTPARACTASSTRSTARSTSTRSSRCPTPAACSRCSSSPTSRRRSSSPSRRPSRGRSCRNSPTPEPQKHGDGVATWTLRAHPAHLVATSPRSSPARTRRRSRELTSASGRVIPLGVYARKSPVAVPRRRLHLREDPSGLRLLRGEVRLPVPVREVRPALRARVQRRRDGERGRRDLHRDLRVPLEGDRRDQGAPRRHDPARARAHVVRRPRHDEVVERPLAQRVVRRVGVDDRHRRGHRVDRGVDDVPGDGEDLGVPPGPAALDAPGRRRRSTTSKTCRSTSTASPTPRAARCSSSSPPGSASTRSSPASPRTSRSTSGATPSCPTCSPSSRRRAAASWAPGRRSGSRRPASTRCRPRSTTDGTGVDHALRDHADGPRRLPDDPPAPPRRRLLQRHRRRARARPPRRARRRRRPHRGSRARRAASAPTSCCSTTTTSPTRRSASTTRSLQTAIEHLGGIADPLARSLVWGAAWDQTRDAESSPSDYVDLVLRNIGSETESTTMRTTLAQLQLAANSYVAPEKREPRRAKVADGLWELAQAAEAGQRQPAPVRHVVRDRGIHARALGAGGSLRDGAIDARGPRDRHRPVVAAARSRSPPDGVADAQAIDDALAADNTAKGGEFAAQAKAAIPNSEAQARRVGVAHRQRRPAEHDRALHGARVPASGDASPSSASSCSRTSTCCCRSGTRAVPDRAVHHRGPVPGAAREPRAARRDARLARRQPRRAAALRRLVDENLAGVERALAVQERDAAVDATTGCRGRAQVGRGIRR